MIIIVISTIMYTIVDDIICRIRFAWIVNHYALFDGYFVRVIVTFTFAVSVEIFIDCCFHFVVNCSLSTQCCGVCLSFFRFLFAKIFNFTIDFWMLFLSNILHISIHNWARHCWHRRGCRECNFTHLSPHRSIDSNAYLFVFMTSLTCFSRIAFRYCSLLYRMFWQMFYFLNFFYLFYF